MKEPKSLEDFSKMRPRQKIKWIDSMPEFKSKPAGIIADSKIDIMLYFERGLGGNITKIKAEKLSDVYRRNAGLALADKALANPN